MPASPTSAGNGDRADFPSLQNRFLIRSHQTGGRFALVEHTIAPRRLAAPVHTHENEDEYSYVLGGRLGAMVGDQVVEAGPGELVTKPRGIPHAFWNAGDEPAACSSSSRPAPSSSTSPTWRPSSPPAARRTSRRCPPSGRATGSAWTWTPSRRCASASASRRDVKGFGPGSRAVSESAPGPAESLVDARRVEERPYSSDRGRSAR